MLANKALNGRDVYIVDGSRTPFLKARNKTGPFTGSDLAVETAAPLLTRQAFTPDALDEVITGCMMPGADEANIGRVIALRLGCGNKVPGFTVQRNCASGLQALDDAAQLIAQGRADLILAGGTDAMSHAPLLFNKGMSNWLGAWMGAKTFTERARVITQFRPGFLAPVIALLKGLNDPIVGLSMGQTAENLAYRFGITRQAMDEFASRSHQRLAAAEDAGFMKEITPIFTKKGQFYNVDDGLRRDSTPEKLAKLKPFFDKKYGAVTPGNSSQVTDGAAFLILASKDAVIKYNLPVMAKIIDVEWAALDPAQMGLGPVHAATPILQRNQLTLNDIDYWEINEAFAAQVIACVRAWQDKEYCQQQLGLSDAFGVLDENKLNIDGGAVAMGHPIGASGARIVLHLMHVLRRKDAELGMAAICIGGGQGGAMLIRRVDGVDN